MVTLTGRFEWEWRKTFLSLLTCERRQRQRQQTSPGEHLARVPTLERLHQSGCSGCRAGAAACTAAYVGKERERLLLWLPDSRLCLSLSLSATPPPPPLPPFPPPAPLQHHYLLSALISDSSRRLGHFSWLMWNVSSASEKSLRKSVICCCFFCTFLVLVTECIMRTFWGCMSSSKNSCWGYFHIEGGECSYWMRTMWCVSSCFYSRSN